MSSLGRPSRVFNMSEKHDSWIWDLLSEPWPGSGKSLMRRPPSSDALEHADIGAVTGAERFLSSI
jgi:hypothetical protein